MTASQVSPPQAQPEQLGVQEVMDPLPETVLPGYVGSGKLSGRVALVSGGDSGIGQAVAVLFAREGADVAVVYPGESEGEEEDAQATASMVQDEGQRCLLVAGDIGEEAFCREAVTAVVREFGGLDVLVNNAAEQHVVEDLTDVSDKQLERTFRTNVFGMFHLTKAALPHLGEGSSVVNSATITTYQGKPTLIDYSSTKGAIIAFTRSLSQSLAQRGIRVNAVAPGPVWTALVPATFSAERVAQFGLDTPMGRPGRPEEIAPSYVFLASPVDSSYVSGQVLRPNGGQIVNA